jgi:hypothetical protein
MCFSILIFVQRSKRICLLAKDRIKRPSKLSLEIKARICIFFFIFIFDAMYIFLYIVNCELFFHDDNFSQDLQNIKCFLL